MRNDSDEALRQIVGPDHVRPGGERDAVRGVRPRFVVEPADEREVAGVLQCADALGMAVMPRGGGTKLSWGNPPARADVVLSTARLNRIVDHPWADLTVTVEAGCTIAALQHALGQRGQRIAMDALWPERATVGGVLSANDSGALRLRFGGLRDLIIGATIALADGTLAASGGKVVKNVAGYDLPKLATGALGTLGVITLAVFRLHPLPQSAHTLSTSCGSVEEMQRIIDSIQDSRLAHTSLQVRASNGIGPVIDIRFEGSEGGNVAQAAQLAALTEAAWTTPEPGGSVWDARQDLWQSPGIILKVSVLPTDLSQTLEVVQHAAGTGAGWRVVMYGTGLGCVQIDPVHGAAGAIEPIRSFAESRGGSAVVLRSPADSETTDAWGATGDALALMAAVKHQFDPRGTLNPGRFAGGI